MLIGFKCLTSLWRVQSAYFLISLTTISVIRQIASYDLLQTNSVISLLKLKRRKCKASKRLQTYFNLEWTLPKRIRWLILNKRILGEWIVLHSSNLFDWKSTDKAHFYSVYLQFEFFLNIVFVNLMSSNTRHLVHLVHRQAVQLYIRKYLVDQCV